MVVPHIRRDGKSRRRTFAFTVLSVVIISCTRQKPVVVIDHGWNVEFAKSACELRRDSGNPCVTDPTPEVIDFERRLITSFASEPGCSNVVVIGPAGKAGLEPYWSLMLDFGPGESSQNWSIVRIDRNRTTIRQGEGNPDHIAHAVCSVLNGTGASIRE
jgi:hypothetical protein